MQLHRSDSDSGSECPLPGQECFIRRMTNRWSCSTYVLSEVVSHQPGGERPPELRVRSAQDGPHVASTNVENGPGAKAGSGEVQHGFCDFLRLAQPGQRHSSRREFSLLRTL